MQHPGWRSPTEVTPDLGRRPRVGMRSVQSGEQRWEKDSRPGSSHGGCASRVAAWESHDGATERFHRRTSHSNFHAQRGFSLKDTLHVFNAHGLLQQSPHPYPFRYQGFEPREFFSAHGR